jgi:putative DNA primase/helicase
VVVIPDKDAAGYRHADDVCGRLAGKVATLRRLELPGKGKDVTDWLAFGGSKEKLLHLTEAAPEWRPQVQTQDSWPPQQPLERPLPEVAPFTLTLLPSSFRDWIADIAERMQCPVDFPAVAAMVTLGGVVGRKVGLRPKRFDDWMVVPNLWGALIGRPSIMKTPPLKAVLKPLETLMDVAAEDYDKKLSDFNKQKELARLKKNVLEGKIKSAMRKDRDYEQLGFEMAALDAQTPPQRRRYAVNDCTVQALGQILSENPNGVTVVRDELIGLLKFLESQGQETSRAFYLEGWDGNGRYETDRIGRGHIQIEAICLSVIGTIQPGPLQEYLYAAVEGGIGDDGLMQRFQLAVWPDDPKEWKNIDRHPNHEARTLAQEVFVYADRFTSETLGAKTDDHDEDALPFLHFTSEAQDCFDRWMVVRENHLRQGHEAGAMESHLTKYRSLIPSLALLIHLAEFKNGDVGRECLERAIGWGDYLASHARRIYASTQAAPQQPLYLLAAKLQQGHIKDGFTARDIHKCHWTGLNDLHVIEEALGFLGELGWLRPERKTGVGRPTVIYRIHPQLQKPAKSLQN